MAQPRDYTRQYNFKDFQATSPSSPLPGTEVDAELNSVKLTLDDLNANIAKVQRDDGKLGNASVHKDAFDQGALAIINSTFTPRGIWATASSYVVNDAVDFNGATYVATSAHTSSAALEAYQKYKTDMQSGPGGAADRKVEADNNQAKYEFDNATLEITVEPGKTVVLNPAAGTKLGLKPNDEGLYVLDGGPKPGAVVVKVGEEDVYLTEADAKYLKLLHWDGSATSLSNTICGSGYWERSTVNLKPRTSF